MINTPSMTRLCACFLVWLPLVGCSGSGDGRLDDGGNVNQNGDAGNVNDNGDTNDNANAGTNDNGGGGGNANDNGNSNANDNVNDNSTDNGDANDGNTNDNANQNANTNQNDNGDACAGRFTLTVDLISAGAGSVALSPQEDCFAPGSAVTITATANPTFRFVGFGGDVQTSSATASVLMDADKSISVTFAGNLFIASDTSVLEFDSGSGDFVREFVVAGAGGLANPAALVFRPRGDLFVSIGHAILRFDGTDGGFIDEFVSTGQGGLGSAWGIEFDAGGDLLVADDDTVRQYDGDNGEFVGEFVTAQSGDLDAATALRFGPNGNLFVAGLPGGGQTGAVWEYDSSTGALAREFVPPGSVGLGIVFDMIFGNDGDLFVAVALSAQVKRYDGSSGMPADCPCLCIDDCPDHTLPAGAYNITGLTFPSGLAWGPQDNLLVVSGGTVRQFQVPAAGPIELDIFIPADDAYEINTLAYLAIKPLP